MPRGLALFGYELQARWLYLACAVHSLSSSSRSRERTANGSARRSDVIWLVGISFDVVNQVRIGLSSVVYGTRAQEPLCRCRASIRAKVLALFSYPQRVLPRIPVNAKLIALQLILGIFDANPRYSPREFQAKPLCFPCHAFLYYRALLLLSHPSPSLPLLSPPLLHQLTSYCRPSSP